MDGSDLFSLPGGVLLALGATIVLQLALQVIALIQVAKTPADRVTIGGRKWAWVLIIALGELLGAIAWFAAGRTPAPADDVHAVPTVEGKRSAVDSLYGPKDTGK